MKTLATLIFLIASAYSAVADAPRVVTSVAPVQGLVTDIMKGVGAPEVLLAEPVSTHDFALRPSQARAIGTADVLFYVGQGLEPWLEKALRSYGDDVVAISLGDVGGVNLLEARELQDFGHHDHDDEHDHEGAFDPHLWLDPANAVIWLEVITDALATLDPDNRAIYAGNFEQTRDEILRSVNNITTDLVKLANVEIIVTHDSFHYFEEAFDLNVIGALSASDGQKTGARNLNKLLGTVGNKTCIVEDITHPNRILNNLPSGTGYVSLDPMGYDQMGAKGYYPNLLLDLTNSLMNCLD